MIQEQPEMNVLYKMFDRQLPMRQEIQDRTAPTMEPTLTMMRRKQTLMTLDIVIKLVFTNRDV